MRLGIFAKTFPGINPGTVLRQAKAAGFETAQYNMACSGLPSMPDAIPPQVASAVAAASSSVGVSICAVSGTYNMAHPDPAMRAQGLGRLRVIAEACGAMGTTLITLCTGTRDPDDQWRGHPDNGGVDAWRDMRSEMEKAVLIADAFGLSLGIEPELANIVDSAANARRLLDEIGSPTLKIVLDPANLFEVATLAEQRRLVAEAVDLLGDRIVMAHAKDRTPSGDFTTAGKGVIDFRHYLGRLRAAGFDGDIVTHGLAADDAPGVAAFLSGFIR